MNRVLDRLWIGSASDLDGTTPLPSLGFVAVVDLCGATCGGARYHKSIPGTVFHLPNRDGDPWTPAQVDECCDFIRAQARTGRVLVACAAGMSRSASMVIGYLVRCGFDPAEALGMVKRARSVVAPMPSMVECVLKGAR